MSRLQLLSLLLPVLWAPVVSAQGTSEDPRELYESGLERYNAGDPEGAAELLSRAATLTPDVPDYRFHLGLAYLKLGKVREAARELEAALGMMGMRRQTRLKEPMVLTQAGLAYLQLGDARTARKRLELAVKRDPGLADAHYGLGLLARQAGDESKALESFGAALAIDRDHPEANIAMAKWLESRGNLEEAREHLRHATHGAPRNYDVLMALGSLAYRQGVLDEAAEAYEIARLLAPDDPEATYNLGTVRVAQERYPEAIELLEPLLREGAERLPPGTAFNLAQAYVRLERYDPARQLLESLLAEDGDGSFPGTAFALGLVAEAMSDDEAAERAYRRAIEDFPEEPRAYLNLAILYERLDRLDEALELLRASLQLTLEPGQSDDIRKAIESLESARP